MWFKKLHEMWTGRAAPGPVNRQQGLDMTKQHSHSGPRNHQDQRPGQHRNQSSGQNQGQNQGQHQAQNERSEQEQAFENDQAQTEQAGAHNDAQEQGQAGGEGSPQERIAQLEAELEEMKNRWMRSEAECQNIRTRAQREVEEAHQYGIQKFARDIVEAEENLERGLASLPPAQEGESEVLTRMREGLKTTERSFLSILERHGITRHDAAGLAFDANEHQAMQDVASPDHAPGQVVQAWTPTWKLRNRLLKPAMVVVANDQSSGQK